MAKEVFSIQKALGEKIGMIVFSVSLSVSGVIIALVKGWNYALVIMCAAPFLALATVLLAYRMQSGFREVLAAYSQSAGYAEQALNAIKVVTAYGMETTEVENYSKYLDRARHVGVKTHFWSTLVMAFVVSTIYLTYAYSYFFGGIFIAN